MTHVRLVHPEIEGVLVLTFRKGSLSGTARFNDQTYETTLADLLKQGWVSESRPKYSFRTSQNSARTH